jgi:NADP-dependent 3-hydroxy acid dehydrogenase YdfG
VIYGAGSSVGMATARYLADNDFGLILIDLRYERLRQTEIYLQDNVKK